MKVLRSDSRKLQSLVRTLSKTDALFLRMRQEAAIEGRKQVRRAFAENRDPYGRPWAQLQLRAGRPLNDTGRLAEFTVALTPTGFTLTSGTSYAATHQYGATIVPVRAKWLSFSVDGVWYRAKKVVIPRRQMVPEGTWGDIWTQAFTERFEKIVAEWTGHGQSAA